MGLGREIMRESTVTLKDVSRAVGLHPSTVSLCLNNSPKVAGKTSARVQAAARQMGYQPHPHLKALMRHRRLGGGEKTPPTVGLVTFYPTRNGWRERFPATDKIIAGARDKAFRRGFRLEEVWMPLDQYTGERVTERLGESGISGVLLTALPEPRENLDWPWEQLAAVAIGPSLHNPRLHRIRSDHFKSMCVAMRECHRLGYRRPGLTIPHEVNKRTDFRWMAGYLTGQSELGLRDCPEIHFPMDWTRESFLQWFRRGRPDVIFSTRTDQVLSWLEGEGLSAPKDIGVVTLSTLTPRGRVSGIYEHWETQGERAMMVLGNLLTENEFGPQDSPVISVVAGTWVPGQTVRRVDSG